MTRLVPIRDLVPGDRILITRTQPEVTFRFLEPYDPNLPDCTLVRLIYGSGSNIICGANDTLEVCCD